MIFTWILTNLKWIVIGLLSLGVAYFAYNYIHTIDENARSKVVIETQRVTIENKDKQIEAEQKLNRIADEVIQQRDQAIDILADRLRTITDDLGPTGSDQAPDSLKELIRRLSK